MLAGQKTIRRPRNPSRAHRRAGGREGSRDLKSRRRRLAAICCRVSTRCQRHKSTSPCRALWQFTESTFGDLVEVIDQDGNIRKISYNQNGRQVGTQFAHYTGDDRPPTQQEYGNAVADFQQHGTPLPVAPPTRTLITTENTINRAGDLLFTRTIVAYQEWDFSSDTFGEPLFEPWQDEGYVTVSTEIRNESGTVEIDALGRAFRTTDENGRISETIFDARGLAIETRSESPDETGSGVFFVSRTVYDTEGRSIYSTGSFPEGTDPSQITGSHTVYEDGTGRVLETERLLGITIDLVASSSSLGTQVSSLGSAGSIISSSRSFYDDNDRVVETENNYGLKSQTLYDVNGRVIESRSQVAPASGATQGDWLVSRTIYDTDGKVIASTDRFLVPAGTPLGGDSLLPVITQISKSIYDSRDRTIASERYTGALVGNLVASQNPGVAPVGFQLLNEGTLESVSETLYDEASRVYRTVSGRVPLLSLSPTALAQDQALANYPIYEDGVDRYASAGLSTGIISDTLFDDRGRQDASLGHPLPASDLGLTGVNYDGNLIRIRSENSYNSYGQTELSRSGLAHVETANGTFVGIFDEDSIDSKPSYDAFGNVYRLDLIADGTLQSYALTRFDDENRSIAEMQVTAGDVVSVWSDSENSFVIDGSATHIPTKLYIYDADDRLAAVELPAIADPNNGGSITRSRYEYSYDERGNQTGIVDPLGNETRFTFTERGQQATRTLPLGFGDDGVFGNADDASAIGFSESMTYDDLGRMRFHISFEGVVKENIYDGFGRMSAMNYYASEADYAAGLINQRDEYVFDTYGRRSGWTRYEAAVPAALATGVTSAGDDLNFGAIRTEATIFDHRGRILHEISPEGTLSYDYDVSGRMTFTAIDAVIPVVIGSIGTPADPSTSQRVSSYGYDVLGRLVSVSEDATPGEDSDDPQTHTEYSYELLGRKRAQLTIAPGDPIPNSVNTSYLYDSLGRLDVMTDTDGNGNTLASYDYEVRSDGKRTSSIDETWFDENNDGVQDAGEVKTSTYDWTYDDAGRLTDEVLDHWDDAFDQTESFTYDLTGNRVALGRDKGNDGTIDEAITYSYDANDRLLDEVLDDLTATNADTTTAYSYDQTQQTSKTVENSTGIRQSVQSFTYNLQSRMASVTNEDYDATGVLTSRERTSYTYDARSFRVELSNETDAALDGIFTLSSSTEFLANHRNKTGYVQTLRETKFDANGNLVKQIDYMFGDDEIAQRTQEFDASGVLTSDETLIFGHDGHGSARVLYSLAGVLQQAFTFSAYGTMVALHNATAINAPVTNRLSSLGYSGETFDAATQQQYLRARYYNPANGRFNRLDDFSGNNQDPQSLHKYAYVHGNPIMGIDPTGREFSIGGLISSIGIGLVVGGMVGAAAGAAYGAAKYRSLSAAAQGAILGLMYGAAIGAAVGGATYLLASALSALSAPLVTSSGTVIGAPAVSTASQLPTASFIVSMPLRASSAYQAADGVRNGEVVDVAFGGVGFITGYAGLAGVTPWGVAVNLLPYVLRRAVSFRSVKVRLGGSEHEFDESLIGGFIENKSASGFSNPRNRQTEAQWAERQIFEKTVKKLDFLSRPDVQAGASVESSGKPFGIAPDPSIAELSTYRAYQFRINGKSNALKIAVANTLQRLSQRFPEFEFSAKFGVRADD